MADEQLNKAFEKALQEVAPEKANDILGRLKALKDSVNALLIGDPNKASVETELSAAMNFIATEADVAKRKLMISGLAARLIELSQTVQVKPAEGAEVVPTYERTRNYKSGHSTVRGVKPGFEDMPSIEAVKSRTLTGQADIEGFGMEWRKSSWYKRFIDAAAALKFCEPLLDGETRKWIAEVQPAIDLFAGLKDVPKNKWKREIWKFIVADRNVNAPMIYAPNGALVFLLAFDRLLYVQPEVRAFALAGNAADLNKLNIARIRLEKGTGKKRAEKAKERRATVRTYAEVIGSVPSPVKLPVDGAPVATAPDPATAPLPPTPAPDPVPPTPAPDVNTYNPAMDTSPDKLKFGPNKAFLDQYMMDAVEFSIFASSLKIFSDFDIANRGFSPLVKIDLNNVPEDEANIDTTELDKWITDLSKSDEEYWKTMSVTWSDTTNRSNAKISAEVMKNFDPADEGARVILLFHALEKFKADSRYYYFDVKRPIALKLQTLHFLAAKRIYQYATEINRDFNCIEMVSDGSRGAKKIYEAQLLDGFYKEPTSARSADKMPDELWKHVAEPMRSDVLNLYRDMARELAGDSKAACAPVAQKWLEDNKTVLDALTP